MKSEITKISEAIKRENKQELFELIHINTAQAGLVLVMFEAAVSETFCKDIAKRLNDAILKGYNAKISEKQAWCLVFDIIENANKYEAWVKVLEAELADYNDDEYYD